MRNFRAVISILITLITSSNLYAENSLDATISTGITIVDVEMVVETDENSGAIAEDWSEFT
jgi:hypothetical protein